MTQLLPVWGLASVLLALALAAALLPRSRSWHAAGVGVLAVLAIVGIGTAAVVTWSWVVVTEDDLYDAAQAVSDAEHGTPGRVSAQRLSSLVTDEVGRDVIAERFDATAEEEVYEVRPAGAADPAVCVRVQVSAGTQTDLQSSILLVDRGRCA